MSHVWQVCRVDDDEAAQEGGWLERGESGQDQHACPPLRVHNVRYYLRPGNRVNYDSVFIVKKNKHYVLLKLKPKSWHA